MRTLRHLEGTSWSVSYVIFFILGLFYRIGGFLREREKKKKNRNNNNKINSIQQIKNKGTFLLEMNFTFQQRCYYFLLKQKIVWSTNKYYVNYIDKYTK